MALSLTWKHSEVGTPEAVAHSVGSHADVHASIFLLGSGYQQLVEVRAIRAGPNVSRRQDHKVIVSDLGIKPYKLESYKIIQSNVTNLLQNKVFLYLYGGVKFLFITRFNSLKPLDNRLDVTPDFTLERRGSPVVHGGVDRVGTCQDGFRVGTL